MKITLDDLNNIYSDIFSDPTSYLILLSHTFVSANKTNKFRLSISDVPDSKIFVCKNTIHKLVAKKFISNFDEVSPFFKNSITAVVVKDKYLLDSLSKLSTFIGQEDSSFNLVYFGNGTNQIPTELFQYLKQFNNLDSLRSVFLSTLQSNQMKLISCLSSKMKDPRHEHISNE